MVFSIPCKMDKFLTLNRLCRRLYLICIIIVASLIFILYLENEHVSNIHKQYENTVPIIDPYVFKTRNRVSEASTVAKPSPVFRDRQQTYRSFSGWLWTSENAISFTSKTTPSPSDSIIYSSNHHETDHNNTTNVHPSINSKHSTSLPSNINSGDDTKSPTTLPVPETCQLFTMEDAKLILLWTPFFDTWGGGYFPQENLQQCSHCRNCRIITDRTKLLESDAVIFHARDMYLSDLPTVRYPHQRWIFYCLESPPYSDFPGLQYMTNMFNWTMTYRTDSDIVSRYGAVVRNQQPKQIDLKSLQRYFEKKSKSVVWMTSHCPTYGGRDKYVKELRKFIEVDVYGTCGSSVCPPGDTNKCLQDYADKYKFFLAFENTICKDYITEKLYRNLKYDIIPVVFGGADYDKFLPPGSYIDALSFQSPKHLALLMSAIGRDFKLYSSYFKWRENYSIEVGNQKECDLCTMLHRKDLKPSTYSDMRKWWVTDSQCRAWEPKR